MIKAILLATATVVVCTPALAQTDLRALRDRNADLQRQDTLRQDLLASRREADAARDRYAAALARQKLRAERREAPQPGPAVPPRPAPQTDLGVEMERMSRATDARLAQSTVRLRSIRPASGD